MKTVDKIVKLSKTGEARVFQLGVWTNWPSGEKNMGRLPDATAEAVSAFPASWLAVLQAEFEEPYFRELLEFVARERAAHEVYPPSQDMFRAFQETEYDRTNVLLLGQDPYPGPGQAHGLCFSVRRGVKKPASLQNIFKELHDDISCRAPNHGCLDGWARQGILMLNAVLTVRAGEPNSHAGKGWERFTDAVIRAANERPRMIFVLWGAYAQKKIKLIDADRNTVIAAAHPSPLSARNGFFGSKPFSQINRALRAAGKPEIDWQLPDE